MLLLLLVLIPLVGALIALFIKDRPINVPLITSAIMLAGAIWGLKGVFQGASLAYKLVLPGPFSPRFQADPLTAIFVILASFLWLVISIYAPDYMQHEGKAKMFSVITLLTLSTVMGVFTAGDLVTMLLFFELMTIASFFWVVHRWNSEAVKAGYFYLFFSIIGGLFIALGIVLAGAATGSLPVIGGEALVPVDLTMFAWSIALFVAGFGIKAGMAPLHLWLPHAHSVAPTPGSALLSGLLIKVGAYGLLRVGGFAGWGAFLSGAITWLGPFILTLGLATMLTGVIAALLQGDAKRLLAYHSVSQMGYIILGIGTALYLGPHGQLGFLGSVYHIVNHALFKAALFLGVGIIYVHTSETDLYKLGGLWRRFPVTAFLMFLAVLGITGAPGLNGYASKTLLHHAIDQAAAAGSFWLVWAERLFSLVGVGTAASFAKLFYLIFLGKPTKLKVAEGRHPSLRAALALLAVVMLGLGIMPHFFPSVLAAPAAQVLGFEGSLDILAALSFWNFSDLFAIFVTLGLGALVCWAGLKSGAFHWQPPLWLSLEGLGKAAYQEIARLWIRSIDLYQAGLQKTRDLGLAAASDLHNAYLNLGRPKEGKIGGVVFAGVSASAALLIMALVFLIVFYTIINPGLPTPKIFQALARRLGKWF